ncbi:MAG: tRNA (N(6)-L-threonylcarbamoyladenosine(37)-C(2))-methylthiotransferase MtaB [Anaerovoracaceae bacterium]
MKVAFHTLGCKVNQYETESLKMKFKNKGYQLVEEDDVADIYVINTCTVTGLADRKSRQYIRRMKKKNPDSVMAVTGCYAQIDPEKVKSIQGVDLVAGTNEKNNLVEYIENYLVTGDKQVYVHPYEKLTQYEETGTITSMESRTRAYIKIQEGCNRFCTYCVIPYARGQVRSRKPEEILKEAKMLIDNGFKELILTGINAALYGQEPDFSLSDDLKTITGIHGIEVIIKMLNDLEGDFRIRLSSLEPTVIKKENVKRLLAYKRLCPHLHLSIQSGSDNILKTMNRNYTVEEYLDIVKMLKDHDPEYGITTDLIVGFPGESEEDFQDSLAIIRKSGFCKVHGFKYSKRPKTKAADMQGQISPDIKKQRGEALAETSEEVACKFFTQNIGKIRKVLFEEYVHGESLITGYTDNYIKVYVENNKDTDINQFAQVRLGRLFQDGMMGEIVI